MRTLLLLSAAIAAAIPTAVDASLVTHFNFDGYDGDANVINADSGSGVITLEESGGGAWPQGDLNVGSGTTLNQVSGENPPANNGLGMRGQNIDGRTLTVAFSTLGLSELVLSFASSGSTNTFDTAQLSYSINGSTFVNHGVAIDPRNSAAYGLESFDLSSVTALNNLPTAYLRLTFSGAGSNATLLLDNLQVTSVPEPSGIAMLAVPLLFWGGRGRRRHLTLTRSRRKPAAQ